MDRDPATPPAVTSTPSQRLARIALATAVVAVGLWILREFLAALAWAAVLAIAFWPLYRRLPSLLSPKVDRVLAPLLVTTVIGIIFIAPLVLLGIALARESKIPILVFSITEHDGFANIFRGTGRYTVVTETV